MKLIEAATRKPPAQKRKKDPFDKFPEDVSGVVDLGRELHSEFHSKTQLTKLLTKALNKKFDGGQWWLQKNRWEMRGPFADIRTIWWQRVKSSKPKMVGHIRFDSFEGVSDEALVRDLLGYAKSAMEGSEGHWVYLKDLIARIKRAHRLTPDVERVIQALEKTRNQMDIEHTQREIAEVDRKIREYQKRREALVKTLKAQSSSSGRSQR